MLDRECPRPGPRPLYTSQGIWIYGTPSLEYCFHTGSQHTLPEDEDEDDYLNMNTNSAGPMGLETPPWFGTYLDWAAFAPGWSTNRG